MSNATPNELAANENFAIRRPTAADVRAYMEFLAERHPQLLRKLEQAADSLVADGVDLSQLLDEGATETTSLSERPNSPLPPE